MTLWAAILSRFSATASLCLARAHTFGYLATRFFRRHWVSVGVATMIVTIVIGAVVGTTMQMAEAERQRDHARFEARARTRGVIAPARPRGPPPALTLQRALVDWYWT